MNCQTQIKQHLYIIKCMPGVVPIILGPYEDEDARIKAANMTLETHSPSFRHKIILRSLNVDAVTSNPVLLV